VPDSGVAVPALLQQALLPRPGDRSGAVARLQQAATEARYYHRWRSQTKNAEAPRVKETYVDIEKACKGT
jgi:hypothetical protein